MIASLNRLQPVFLAAWLAACSPIMLEDDSQANRRVYANDKAANDSLAKDLLGDGVRFVLQPGKPYEFKLATSRTSDILDLYSHQGGGRKAFRRISAVHDGTRQVFAITSPLSAATFYSARLLTGVSAPSPGTIRHVALESLGDVLMDTLQVKLLFMQTLKDLPTEASKSAFAAAFFAEMNRSLSPHSIAVVGIHESVDAASPPLVFPFTNFYVPLSGRRQANHAHLYLVDSISVGNASTGPKGEVLGFAAREVVDLSDHRESRVILAKTHQATLARLAVTAVHELGHFFGLRHTVSTRHDMLQDKDISNIEDGFTDTPYCSIDEATLAKTASDGSASWPGPAPGGDGVGAGPYCLRSSDYSCSEPTCDLQNLMHPVECAGVVQTQLTPQQVAFLRRNMALYRR